jgi:uncharacterized protein YaiL (DUF2058 family)
MSDSLRDQLLKAGLVTKKQATKSERSQQQYRGGKGRKPEHAGSQGPSGDAARAAKATRDRELNREQQAKVEARARRAQLRQIIDQHRVAKPETDEYFNFVDGGKVHRIPVDPNLRARLVAGTLVIARCDGRYDLVPAEAASLIRERDAAAVIQHDAPSASAAADDDPYREFAVPDDLTW